jgi:uncharacterized protein GlcG (DUF336 family)
MTVSFAKQSISHETAAALVAAAVARAHELGTRQVVAVLDESGNLKAFCRMDGAPVASIQAAQDKAYTALFGLASQEFFEAIENDRALLASLPNVPRMLLIGGGVPIYVEGQVIGAIGVGGGTIEQDIACARAGLNALEKA